MIKRIAFRHMEKSEAMEQHAHQKLDRRHQGNHEFFELLGLWLAE